MPPTLPPSLGTAVPHTDQPEGARVSPRGGGGGLTLGVEQLVLDGNLRLAPRLCLAVDHPLVAGVRLQIHKASLQVVNDVRSVGRDLLGRELPVEGDLGRQDGHSARNHSLPVWVQVDDIKVTGRRYEEFTFLCKGKDTGSFSLEKQAENT